jgi:hypothetical protein
MSCHHLSCVSVVICCLHNELFVVMGLRIAGLRAAEASLSLMEEQALCSRLLPQVCLLLVDKSPEVRDLALGVMEASCVIMKTSHVAKRKQGVPASPASGTASGLGGSNGNSSSSSQGQSPSPSAQRQAGHSDVASGSGGQSGGGWASWAVGGIAKSIEQATIQATSTESLQGSGFIPPAQPAPARPVASVSTGPTKGMQLAPPSHDGDSSGVRTSTADEWRTPSKTTPEPAGWSDDDDIAFDDDEMDTANDAYTSNMGGGGKGSAAADFGDEGMDSPITSPPVSQRGGGTMKLSVSANSLNSTGSDDARPAAAPGGLSKSTTKKSTNSAATSGTTGAAVASKKPPKAVVKKLAVTSDDADNWDDF